MAMSSLGRSAHTLLHTVHPANHAGRKTVLGPKSPEERQAVGIVDHRYRVLPELSHKNTEQDLMTRDRTTVWVCYGGLALRGMLASVLLAVTFLGFSGTARGAHVAAHLEAGGCVQSPTTQCVIDLTLAATDKISSAYPRAEVLIRIAEAQVEAGEIGKARRTLSLSLIAAAAIDRAAFLEEPSVKISPDDEAFRAKARVLTGIAKILTNLDEKARAQKIFSRALNSAERMEVSHYRAKSLVEIAKAQVAAGALQQARYTFARADIGKNAKYLPALRKIVRMQAEAGDASGALNTARSIPNGNERALAIAEIAAAQATTSDVAGAGVTAKGIQHAYFRMVAMHYIGVVRAQNGDIAGAWDAVGEIVEIWKNDRSGMAGSRDATILQADTVQSIVETHIRAGRFEDALAATEGIADQFAFVEAHAAVARAQISVGALDDARITAKAMCSGHHYAGHCVEVLAELAAALDSTGRAKDAQDILSLAQNVAQRITYYRNRSRAFVALHTAKIKMGDLAGARRAFTLALNAAAEISYTNERAERFSEIGVAAFRTGDDVSATRAFSDALTAASELEEVHERVETLVRLGLAQKQAGHIHSARGAFSSAVAFTGAVESVSQRAKLFAGIAFALASGKCEKRTLFSDDPFAICINQPSRADA